MKNIAIQLLEASAVPFVLELEKCFKKQFPQSQCFFLIPYPHIADSFRKKHDGEPTILSDPFRNNPLQYFKRPLTEDDRKEIQRLEKKYHLQRGFWFTVGEERAFLYKRSGLCIHRMNRNVSRNIMLRATLARYGSIEQFLLDHEVDTIIFASEDCGTQFGTALLWIGKGLGLNVNMPLLAKVKNKAFFTSDYVSPVPRLAKKYQEYLSLPIERKLEAREYIDRNRSGKSQSPYLRAVDTQKKRSCLTKVGNVLVNASSFYFRKRNRFYDDRGPIKVLSGRLMSKIRTGLCLLNFPYAQSKNLGKYLYFPLHVEPELALLCCAPYQGNQISIIQKVAKSLPADVTLAVKEHPHVRGNFPMSFYQQIVNTPNVVLLDPKENSTEIMEKAVGVATITGTAALEAVILGKPSITFGTVFFNLCKSIHKFESWESLHVTIASMEDEVIDEDDLVSFVQALLDISYSLELKDLTGNDHSPDVTREMTKAFFDAFVNHTAEMQELIDNV